MARAGRGAGRHPRPMGCVTRRRQRACTFIRWLNEDMEPAIRKVRAAISSSEKSQT